MKSLVYILFALSFVNLVENKKIEPSFIDIALLVDYDMFSEFQFDSEKLHVFLHDVFIKVQDIYRPLQIYLRTVNVSINEEQWSYSYRPIQDLVYNFINGQKFEYFKDIKHDVLLVLSGSDFNGTISAGEASGHHICTNLSVAVIRYINQSRENFILTFVHELGHLLGLSHDSSSCYCEANKNQCIMENGAKYVGEYIWSSCSRYQVHRLLQTCPKPLNKTNVSIYPVCGNAIVEDNEWCDCLYNDQECFKTCLRKLCLFKQVEITASVQPSVSGEATNLSFHYN